MTITDAIKEVMRARGAPVTAREAYEAIIELGLYEFHAENPLHIVASQIRRHCRGLDFPSASETKYFELREDGKYFFLPQPIRQSPGAKKHKLTGVKALLRDLRVVHQRYDHELRSAILANLKGLSPRDFEHFARRLLNEYGFINMVVTPQGRDGGIDGYGRLKIGLAYMNVAFQCKRFNDLSVGRPKIDEFRGAIQGEYEQGIFFTTSKFVETAKDASLRRGAVPIVLVDGPGIVNLMIEKQFGVQAEEIPVYSYALDLVLSDDSADDMERKLRAS